MSTRRRVWHTALEVGVPVLIVALWWVWSENAQDPFFPPLSDILTRFRELWLFAHLTSDILPSLAIVLVGFGCSATLGVVAGVLLARVRPMRELLEPLLTFLRAVPMVAAIPVIVATMGFGDGVRLLIIVVAATPPMLIATMDGVSSLDPVLKDVMQTFRLSRWDQLMRVYVPQAGAQIFSGLQVCLQYSFVLMIASEMLGATRGIGYMTLLAQQTFVSVDMWAGILLLGAVGYLANLSLTLVRKRVLRWYDGAHAVELRG
ncbi:ABC transporter permease [Nocardioides sp. zg-ZUI104]|uniref:ABC transporter permease n=1 Tax=Nocardioides faecalis TaxID=2803858 RepID=UPI001BD12DDC|nr:ABC transporter permease [Nocardioides faecalis]MBS4751281.1 ABC transporter permease [Nocardioides faecalis]